MVFVLGALAIAATVAQAGMSYQQARDAASIGQRMSDWNNKKVLANYRRNQLKLSEARVDSRRIHAGRQTQIVKSHNNAIRDFEAGFADNWGQSASLFLRSVGRSKGENVEQLSQNLERELVASREQEEELRLGIESQLSVAPADQSKAALVSGLISIGSQAVSSAYDISANMRQEKIDNINAAKSSLELQILQEERDRIFDYTFSGRPRTSQWDRSYYDYRTYDRAGGNPSGVRFTR